MNVVAEPLTDTEVELAAHTNGAVVAARQLGRRYGDGDTAIDALRSVDLEVEREKLTAVMGPSGPGKSTLMHLLAGLDKPTRATSSSRARNLELGRHGAHEAAPRSTSASSSSSSTCCRC